MGDKIISMLVSNDFIVLSCIVIGTGFIILRHWGQVFHQYY